MGTMQFETDCRLPAVDRLAQWQQQITIQLAPVELRIDRPGEFTASLITSDVGVLHVSTLANRSSVPYLVERMPALIRRSDPEAYRLLVNLRGSYQASHCELDATAFIDLLAALLAQELWP